MRRTLRLGLGVSFLVCQLSCDAGEIGVFSALGGSSSDPGGAAGASVAGSSGSAGAAELGGTAGALVLTAGQPSAAQGGEAHDVSCRMSADCDPAWFCEKATCADPTGACVPRPLSDDTGGPPVCGCDHVTYWNDTLRRQFGISASLLGECHVGARACDSDADCGPGATCAHLLPPMTNCSSPGSGTCWVTPSDCPPMGDRPHWQACPSIDGAGAGSPAPCLTTCLAVQSGHLFLGLERGSSCP